VGRTTLREALRVLSCVGIVTILPGHGTYLASKNTGFHVSLSWAVLLGENSVDHLIDVRNELEAVSARLAAKNTGKASTGELDGIYQKMKVAFDQADFRIFLDLDLDFHLAIARCSRNPIIHDLLATSRRMLKIISRSGMANMEDLRNIYDEHGEIYAAIVERDAFCAQEKMVIHLANARKRYHLKSEFGIQD
jgi:DNA-binding FadR family transcriptional regulator